LSDITNQVGEGVETLTRLVEDVRAGHGTVGRLMYENRNRITTEILSLIGDIRKDPRKDLTVRVSIF
jgi:hypothetical protein